MAHWRARVTLHPETDKQIRDLASRSELGLKSLIHSLLDEGINLLAERGTDHTFLYTDEERIKGTRFEYVIDDTYRERLQRQSHLFDGGGKLGKTLGECLLIGLAQVQ